MITKDRGRVLAFLTKEIGNETTDLLLCSNATIYLCCFKRELLRLVHKAWLKAPIRNLAQGL